MTDESVPTPQLYAEVQTRIQQLESEVQAAYDRGFAAGRTNGLAEGASAAQTKLDHYLRLITMYEDELRLHRGLHP